MLDALSRIEHQLVDAAARRQAEALPAPAQPAQWRPPRAVLVALILLALASGASAVTGVGPLGDLFEPEKTGLAPESAAPRVTLAQRAPSGEEVAMRAYENNEGALCIQSPPVGDLPAGEVRFSCAAPAALAAEVEAAGTFAAVNLAGPGVSFYGLVDADVTRLRVAHGAEPVEAKLADETIGGYRPFLALLDGPIPTPANPLSLTFDEGRAGRWPPSE